MLLQVGVGPDDYCKVRHRIPALTAAQAEAFAEGIEHGNNITMCASQPITMPSRIHPSPAFPRHDPQMWYVKATVQWLLHRMYRTLDTYPPLVSKLLEGELGSFGRSRFDRTFPTGRLQARTRARPRCWGRSSCCMRLRRCDPPRMLACAADVLHNDVDHYDAVQRYVATGVSCRPYSLAWW